MNNPQTYSSNIIDDIVNNNIEAIALFPSTSTFDEALKIIRLNRDLSSEIKLLGNDIFYQYKTLTRGDNSIVGLTFPIPAASGSDTFLEISGSIFGGRTNWRTAAAYDATQAFVGVLKKLQKPNRELVLKQLKNITLPPSQTAGYSLNFSPEGDRIGNTLLVQVKKSSSNVPSSATSRIEFKILD